MSVRLLVADDSKTERLFFKKLAEKLGTEPHFAESGADCIKHAEKEKYDIIFIDYLMPEMDGIQTVKEIQKNVRGANAGVPMIALGSPDKPSDDEFFQKEGFVNYIEKPVDYSMLCAALMIYLPDDKRELIEKELNAGVGGSEEEEIDDELKWLNNVPEISPAEGVKNCGSVEGYISALNIFYNSIDDKADEIMRYYDSEDWVDYTIKVHALKSSARIIGAADLSADALELETAGNANDLDLIREKTAGVIALFRSFKDKLSPLSAGEEENEEEKPLAEKDFLEDAYSSLVDFADQMDFDLVEMVLESVKEYRLEAADKEIFNEIDKKFNELDWHGIAEAARKGLET